MSETIKLGSTGVLVQAAQYLSGFTPFGTIAENTFTKQFEDYIKNWQRINELDADGIIGDKSWKVLADSAQTVSTSKNRKSSYTYAIQTLLNLDVDGICGQKTKAAIAAFQASADLKADGICGPKTWAALLGVSESGGGGEYTFVQPPNFKQYDSRWAKKMYSNHGDTKQTMASSACGPTSMADVVAEWWDVNITPYDLAKLSMEWGTRTYDSGTTTSFFKKCAAKYGASQYLPTSSIKSAIECLRSGGYVIVCFGPGKKGTSSYQKWTKGG
jgi:hypothetical protein